jgi:hypothetical protein
VPDLFPFTRIVVKFTLPRVQILLESVQYNARALLLVESIFMKVLRHPGQPLYGAEVMVRSIRIIQNSGFVPKDRRITQQCSEIGEIRFSYFQTFEVHKLSGKIDAATIQAFGTEVAIIRQFIEEMKPIPNQVVKDENPVQDEPLLTRFEMDIIADEVDLVLWRRRDTQIREIGRLRGQELTVSIAVNKDHSKEASVALKNIVIRDERAKMRDSGAPTTLVMSLWKEQCSGTDPMLRVLAKIGAAAGDVSVFNQIEVNLKPTVVRYDAGFFKILIDFIVLTDMGVEKCVCIDSKVPENSIEKPDYKLPESLLAQELLPAVNRRISDLLENKSKEYELTKMREDKGFVLRYLKVACTKFNVSYFNPENAIFTQFSDICGLLHEIVWQDFHATMKTVVDRLISEISHDLFPQFVKSCVGLGKIANKEAEMQLWLNNDHDQAPQRKKELIFGKPQRKK